VLATRRRRAHPLGLIRPCSRRGSSIVEVVVSIAVLMVGVLAFARSMTQSMALGRESRETALATAALQGLVEELYAVELDEAFARYNDDPDDDPGSGTSPGARFAVEGLTARPEDAGLHGRIFFPSPDGSPDELREDTAEPCDLDLDGVIDSDDHASDYRVLPVRVRIAWQDGRARRELEVSTILGVR
jgi:hypothetical protein